jgi:hypothetical protein
MGRSKILGTFLDVGKICKKLRNVLIFYENEIYLYFCKKKKNEYVEN